MSKNVLILHLSDRHSCNSSRLGTSDHAEVSEPGFMQVLRELGGFSYHGDGMLLGGATKGVTCR